MDAANNITSKSTGFPIELTEILSKLKTQNISDFIIIAMVFLLIWFQIFHGKKFPKKRREQQQQQQQQQQQNKYRKNFGGNFECIDLIDGKSNDNTDFKPTNAYKVDIENSIVN